MPDDPALLRLLDDFTRQLADLDARLRALESSPQTPYMSLRQGFMRVLPATSGDAPSLALESNLVGDQAVALRMYGGDGEQIFVVCTDVSGSYPVVLITNPDGNANVLNIDSRGLVFPMSVVSWARPTAAPLNANGYTTVDSTSYTEVLTTILPATHNAAAVGLVWATPDGSTSMDVKMTAEVHGWLHDATPNGEQTIWEQTGLSSAGFITRTDLIPEAVWTPAQSVIGSSYRLRVYIRRASGSGAVGIQATLPVVADHVS